MSASGEFKIQGQPRTAMGSADCRRLRHAGHVPVVTYGHGKPASSLTISKDTAKALVHHPGLAQLEVEGAESALLVIVKEVQRHPVTHNIIHVDLQEVKADETIYTTVRLEAWGEPAGAKHGGQLEQALHDLEVSCLPGDLTETVSIDITAMELDDTMHVRELVLPAGLTPLADPDQAVFQVRLPRVVEAAEAAVEGEEEAEEQETEA